MIFDIEEYKTHDLIGEADESGMKSARARSADSATLPEAVISHG
jgi:hypothetical protein